MNTIQNTAENRKFVGFLDQAAIIVLLIRICFVCYGIIPHVGIFGKITDRLYESVAKMPIIVDDLKCKGLVLVIFTLATLIPGPPVEQRIKYKFPLISLGIGLLLFFGTYYLSGVGDDRTAAASYTIITGLGCLLIGGSLPRLYRGMQYAFATKRFQSDTEGFLQEERLIRTPYSLNFRARYRYNGRIRKSYINIVNPRRGVLIMGSPGSGKSWFIIEPAIAQLTSKAMSLFVYDFKYPVLSQYTYGCFLEYRAQYPDSAQFCCINFSDLSRSHRCNLINPADLRHISDALGISKTILLSMNKTWVSKQGEFFMESSINFLASLIWFLRMYKGGIYCTLPHVIELSKIHYDELFTILNAEPTTRGLIGVFRDAYLNKTMEMLDGQTASARIPVGRLDSPDFYYVLGGNDLNLDINDPEHPVVLCLGGDAGRKEALAPLMSLFVDRLNRRVNQPGKRPMAQVLDEFATIRAASVSDTITTARSNNIITILSVQDLSQLKLRYSHDEADEIMNTAGNLICGAVTGPAADWVSERFHARFRLKTTIAVNSAGSSVSKTEHFEDAVTPATLANLSSGEFVGLIADDPDKKIELKGFHATLVKDPKAAIAPDPLPIVRHVDEQVLMENFARIGKDIQDLVKEEIKRISGDPALRRFVVKR